MVTSISTSGELYRRKAASASLTWKVPRPRWSSTSKVQPDNGGPAANAIHGPFKDVTRDLKLDGELDAWCQSSVPVEDGYLVDECGYGLDPIRRTGSVC